MPSVVVHPAAVIVHIAHFATATPDTACSKNVTTTLLKTTQWRVIVHFSEHTLYPEDNRVHGSTKTAVLKTVVAK